MEHRPSAPWICYGLFCGGTIGLLLSGLSLISGIADNRTVEIGTGLGGLLLSLLIIGFGSAVSRLADIDWTLRRILAKTGSPAVDARVATRD